MSITNIIEDFYSVHVLFIAYSLYVSIINIIEDFIVNIIVYCKSYIYTYKA